MSTVAFGAADTATGANATPVKVAAKARASAAARGRGDNDMGNSLQTGPGAKAGLVKHPSRASRAPALGHKSHEA